MTNTNPTSHKSQIPAKVRDYFGSDEVTLVQLYRDGEGWRDVIGASRRISLTRIASLRRQGFTKGGFLLDGTNRVADFDLAGL